MSQELELALQHHQAGRLAQAEQLYRQILARQPANPDALHFLGVLAHQVGRNEEAIELIESAHRNGRAHAHSLNSLGMAYLGAGRPKEAKRCLTKALALKADYAEAHSNLGAALKALGQMKEAEASYRRALALMPDSPPLHYNLANLLVAAERLPAAEAAYTRALELAPDYAQAHNNLGHLLWRQGRYEEALPSCQAAVALDAGYAEARHNLGKVLEDLGRAEEAEQAYRDALALEPDQVETRLNLGNVLLAAARYEDAEQCYRAVLELHPRLAIAWYNLGNLLARLDRHEEALAAYRTVIELDPGFAPARWIVAMSQLPAVYTTAEEPARARARFSQELERLGQWLAAQRRLSAEAIAQHPFHLAYQEENNRELMTRYGALCHQVMNKNPSGAPGPRASGRRLRVGIVAAQMRQHSVWDALVRGWVRLLDPERFELLLFHLGRQQDEETRAAARLAARFEQGPKSLAQWIGLIREHQPDVLIYPEIAMDMTTIRLAALRLAPVQVTSWGHPETSGLPTMDYYLSAELMEPAGAQDSYSERLITLPNLGCWYEERPADSRAVDLAGFGIEPAARLFVCPGTPFKYAPGHDWVLPAIARRVPGARFLFFTYRIPSLSAKLQRRLQQVFEREGLDFRAHVSLLPWLSPPQFHGLMKQAHVFLDTIGFSGFNNAVQAVESGLPPVTREGRFMRGRLASAVLKRLGLPELIVDSEKDYVALAERLALDDAYRGALRERLAAARPALYADVSAVRGLEDFLSQLR